jgi:hypothetical protein
MGPTTSSKPHQIKELPCTQSTYTYLGAQQGKLWAHGLSTFGGIGALCPR